MQAQEAAEDGVDPIEGLLAAEEDPEDYHRAARLKAEFEHRTALLSSRAFLAQVEKGRKAIKDRIQARAEGKPTKPRSLRLVALRRRRG